MAGCVQFNENVLIQPGSLPNGKNKKITSAHPTTRHHLTEPDQDDINCISSTDIQMLSFLPRQVNINTDRQLVDKFLTCPIWQVGKVSITIGLLTSNQTMSQSGILK